MAVSALLLIMVTILPLHVDSDRITGFQLVSGGEIILTLFGDYLPYYNGSSEQIKLLSKTMYILQKDINHHKKISLYPAVRASSRDKFKQSTIKSDVILNAELEFQTKLGVLSS